jgi:hypothetical protein
MRLGAMPISIQRLGVAFGIERPAVTPSGFVRVGQLELLDRRAMSVLSYLRANVCHAFPFGYTFCHLAGNSTTLLVISHDKGRSFFRSNATSKTMQHRAFDFSFAARKIYGQRDPFRYRRCKGRLSGGRFAGAQTQIGLQNMD